MRKQQYLILNALLVVRRPAVVQRRQEKPSAASVDMGIGLLAKCTKMIDGGYVVEEAVRAAVSEALQLRNML